MRIRHSQKHIATVGKVVAPQSARTRGWLVTTVSAYALFGGVCVAASPAKAQSSATPAGEQAAQAPQIEEVIVTGTRIVRDGYDAPTPTTVMSAAAIEASSPSNISDFVNTLPSFAGGQSSHVASGGGVSSQTKGLNSLNLRGLGVNRTLVLLDGMRVAAAALDGSADITGFPDALIERVDVVTGGASAAYGSDALAGVVNFVLNKNFVGVKGSAQGGVTTYGDDRSYKVSLTAGTNFANGRGHAIINGEVGLVSGVLGDIPRGWAYSGWQIINNPNYTATNGQPRLLVRDKVGVSNSTRGGIITSGPLKGIYFDAGGKPAQFNYGSLVSDPLMSGGDWQYSNTNPTANLDQRVARQNALGRLSYQVSDSINLFAQFSYGNADVVSSCCYQFNFANVTVQRDNAFMPTEIAARMTALGLTTLQMGSMNRDLGLIYYTSGRSQKRYLVGGDGNLDALGSQWTWNAYFQKGVSDSVVSLLTGNNSRYAQAIDAVRTANGSIVCRSTLTNPTDGCVPYNIFGVGVNTQATVNYIVGKPTLNQTITQDVFAASAQGEPFSSWSGPVSVALGLEHRKESVTGTSDALGQQNAYFAGNYKPTIGSYTVTEGFVETVVPLAKSTAWGDSLDLNGAVRFTGYSTSGFVATWKLGLTYGATHDLKFRATRSRDIRAPNLQDAFLSGTTGTSPVTDPFRNNVSSTQRTTTIGNPGLKPEKADTTGGGVVYQPSWFEGFSASFDYYNIQIKDAISTIAGQEIINRCFAGNTALCAQITRDAAGNITAVLSQPFNLVSEHTNGFDIEATYRLPLDRVAETWAGDLTIRGLATHVISRTTDDGLRVREFAGENSNAGPLKWRGLVQATYELSPITVGVTGRYVSSGTYNNSFVQCTSGCPASTATNNTIDFNHIDGAFYADLSFNYKLHSGSGAETEVFLNIQNIADKDPAVVAPGPGGNSYINAPTSWFLYDTLGRQFRAGVRFKI